MRMERWWFTVPLRLRSILRGAQLDRELDEELRFHLEHKIEDGIASGLSPDEARHAALRSRRYEIMAVEKTWWPPFRRWQVIGLSEPMPITRQSTEQWVRETAAFLVQSNVRLGLWRPAEKKPAA